MGKVEGENTQEQTNGQSMGERARAAKAEAAERGVNLADLPTDENDAPAGVTPLERAPRKNPLLDDILALPPSERLKAYAFYRKAVDSFGPIEQHVNKKLDVVGAVHYPAQMQGRDGKTVHYIRAVLILKDGSAVGAASDKAADFARELTTLFGVGPWDFVLKVKVNHVKLKTGSTYSFEVLA